MPPVKARAARPQASRATAAALSRDDRQSLALLLAPFLIVAASLATQQLVRGLPPLMPEITAMRPAPTPAMSPAAVAPGPAQQTASFAPVAPVPSAPPKQSPAASPSSAAPAARPDGLEPSRDRATIAARRAAPPLPDEPRAAALVRPALPDLTALRPAAPEIELPALAMLIEPAPVVARPAVPPLAVPMPPFELPTLALLDPRITPPLAIATPQRAPGSGSDICAAPPGLLDPARKASAAGVAEVSKSDFPLALAAAARAQTSELVIYSARYTRIAYPMGDVPGLYGVCTDVVVRAFRSLGVDLQALIREARSGSGDPNIDHRRVEVVRRFLEKHGERLAITDHAEDYAPGDIVTYYRPQSRTSTSHIAIVTDLVAPSGRYMIAHNRGWGTQIEDALFVDKITGHYRYSGPPERATATAATGAPQSRDIATAALAPRRTAETRTSVKR